MSTTTTDLLKMLATTAVTVATAYQAITAHMDATIASKVQEVQVHISAELATQTRAMRLHADSLHVEQGQRIDSLEDRLPKRRVRTF